ncbi:PaaI family thioesterase [beta proteobacterium MWH-UniP1]
MVSLAIVTVMDNPLKPSFTPFVAHLGAEMVSMSKGQAEIKLQLQPHMENGLGVAHGGLVMTMLDVVMALAAKSSDPDGLGVVTIEMKTSFLRPARGEIHGFGWCDHYSSTMAFCRGELRDTQGRLLAQAMGTFKRMASLGGRKKHVGSD